MITSKQAALSVLAVVSYVMCDSLTRKQFHIYKDNRRWNEARTICEDNGGRLAQIDNQQTMAALLAYSKTNHWKDDMSSHFWIGLNRDDKTDNLRWDRCESVDDSSFTFWKDSSQDSSKRCVFAEKDTLGWISEVCDSSSYQFLCQVDKGSCAYKEFSGTCSGSGHEKISDVPFMDVAQCEDLCSNTLKDEQACWMYSYDSPNCTLYFDENPWACSQPSPATVVKTRVCFTFDTLTSSSTYSNSESKPIIDCDLYTTQAMTTTEATTTTVTPLLDTSIATNTSTMDTILPEVTKSSKNTMTTATSPTTPAKASITMTTDPTSLFTSITMATDSTTLTAASVTMETTVTYPGSMLTGTPQPSTAEAPSSTAAGIAASTAQIVTTTSTASSQATTFSTNAMTTSTRSSSGSRDTCPCLVCVETKTMIETQRFVDAILLLLKLDKSKLSATRRKMKSEPDDRPSAQAIGYSGLIFIIITFSFFVLSDLMRLCQFWSDKKSKPQIARQEQN